MGLSGSHFFKTDETNPLRDGMMEWLGWSLDRKFREDLSLGI